MPKPSRRLLLTVLALGACASLAAPALADDSRPLRLVVPYAPGGPLDVTARVLAEQVKGVLGNVVVENKSGAGGNIGSEFVARAAPTGRVIGVAAVATHAINPWLFPKLPFDPARDFAPITQMVRVPNVLVINADTARRLKIETLDDLVAYARANPGKLNYGSGGNGSAGHLAGEMFKQGAGIFAVHIPFNGASPAQLALVSGQVDFNIDNLASTAANIQAGKLKALAVTTAQPSPLLPGVPSMSRVVPGMDISTWWGLVAPAGTPRAEIDKLNAAFAAALKSPETKERFAKLMAEPEPTTPEQFGQFMASERARYEAAVKKSGAKVD